MGRTIWLLGQPEVFIQKLAAWCGRKTSRTCQFQLAHWGQNIKILVIKGKVWYHLDSGPVNMVSDLVTVNFNF